MKRAPKSKWEIENSKAIQAKRETIQLPKGLTREDALARCRGRWKHDHRGFTYDPKTGKATAT